MKDLLLRKLRLIRNLSLILFGSYIQFLLFKDHTHPYISLCVYVIVCWLTINSFNLFKVIISGKTSILFKDHVIEVIRNSSYNKSLKNLLIKEISANNQLFYIYDYFIVLNLTIINYEIKFKLTELQELFLLSSLKRINNEVKNKK